ncbi:MAG: L,D-transpeptidase family protein [Myxococcota bacterium]
MSTPSRDDRGARRRGALLAAFAGLFLGAATAGGQGSAAWLPLVGRADAHVPRIPRLGAMVAPGAGPAAAASLRRLVPRVVARRAERASSGAWDRALRDALGDVPDAVRAAYRTRPRPVFTAGRAPGPSGHVVLRRAADAVHHGLPAWERRASDLREMEERLGEEGPRRAAPPRVPREDLLAAWRDTAGADDRVAAWSTRLEERAPVLVAAARRRARERRRDARLQARLEVALAVAAHDLARDLAHRPRTEGLLVDEEGSHLSPDRLWQRPSPPPTLAETEALLEAAAEGAESLDAWLDARLPQAEGYRALARAARRYGDICDAGGWERLGVPRYRRRTRWSDAGRIRALERRLAVEGFFEGTPDGVYDDDTVDAVRAYQVAHHLKASGTFEAETARALNVPCEERLRTLWLNLRRWRHVGRTDERTYVEVVLPAMELRWVVDGEVRTTEPVVVGSGRRYYWSRERGRRVYHRATPVLTDAISNVVLNPEWNVPSRIIRREIRPRMEDDPGWLEAHGYRIEHTAGGHEMVVQEAGPDNALGRVKLLFPNAESIYVHDTDEPELFRHAVRDYSHGCVRVDDALELGLDVLEEDMRRRGRPFDLDRVRERMDEEPPETRWFALSEPVPVFFEYLTASVDEHGRVRFHPDIYEYDRRTLGDS